MGRIFPELRGILFGLAAEALFKLDADRQRPSRIDQQAWQNAEKMAFCG